MLNKAYPTKISKCNQNGIGDRDAPDWGDSRSGNQIFVHVLIRPQNAKYFSKADGAKFDVTEMASVIYQMNRFFEENSDLESVFV